FLTLSQTTMLSPLSLHDALPISARTTGAVAGASRLEGRRPRAEALCRHVRGRGRDGGAYRLHGRGRLRDHTARFSGERIVARSRDRKSTRLNSSHVKISYAVFCF